MTEKQAWAVAQRVKAGEKVSHDEMVKAWAVLLSALGMTPGRMRRAPTDDELRNFLESVEPPPDATPSARLRRGQVRPGSTVTEVMQEDWEDLLPEGLFDRLRRAAKNAGVSDAELQNTINLATRQLQSDSSSDTRTLVESQLEALIADWEAMAMASRRPIGVSDDFLAIRQQPGRQMGLSAAAGGAVVDDLGTVPLGRQRSQAIKPRYFEGDQFSPAGQSPEQIARIQSQLVAAGLIEEGEYWAGFWDAATSSAYTMVLGYANQSGLTADDAIRRLQETLPDSVKEARAKKKAMEVFQAPPFMAPDPAKLAQDVKETFRRRLGRDPTPEDLASMTAALGDSYRQAYDAEVAAARAHFNAQLGKGPAGTTVQDVDPASRFLQVFEERYQPELARFDALEEARVNQANVFASLRNMGSLIGGN